MRNRKLLAGLAGIISLSMILGGCSGSSSEETTTETEEASTEEHASAEENFNLAKKVVSNVSYTELTKKEATCQITLNGNDVQCTGDGASYKSGVLTINSAGCYEITGTLEDGRIEINAGEDDEVMLLLNGVSISCSDYAPFVVNQAKETLIYLEEGTVNTFADADSYTTLDGANEDDTPSAAIYSKDDILFGGTGTLSVTAHYNDAICGKDDVQFVSGTYEIEAADDGIVGKDSISIKDGSFHITAAGDGMKSTKTDHEEKGFIFIEDGVFDITASNDALQAETYLWLSNGNFTIESGGGSANAASGDNFMRSRKEFSNMANSTDTQASNQTEEESSDSTKGFKAGTDISILNGTYTMDCADDAFHSNETLTLQGGSFLIKTGDDGIHADYEISIADGDVTIEESYEGIEAQIITIHDGNIDITASDDGINAAGNSSSEGDSFEHTQMEGNRGSKADMGEMPDGDMVMPTDGQMPDMGQKQDMKQMPDDGDMVMPTDGQMPDMGQKRDMGKMPDGDDMVMPTDGQMPDRNDAGKCGMGGMMDGSEDDNALLTIAGGEIHINANGDGIDSNGHIIMSGGTVYVEGPVNDGNGIIDYGLSFNMTGGTLIGTGSSGMLQTISDSSSQAGLAVVFDSSQTAGTTVTLKDKNGTELLSYESSKAFTAVIFSDKALQTGETYDIYLNDSLYKSIELTSVSTTDGSSGMGTAPGRGNGGGDTMRRQDSMPQSNEKSNRNTSDSI